MALYLFSSSTIASKVNSEIESTDILLCTLCVSLKALLQEAYTKRSAMALLLGPYLKEGYNAT